jgi:regulator of replication initiation timing
MKPDDTDQGPETGFWMEYCKELEERIRRLEKENTELRGALVGAIDRLVVENAGLRKSLERPDVYSKTFKPPKWERDD